MPIEPRPRPVVLCVLDGWGHREEAEDNAIALADTPVYDRLMRTCPHSLLGASAEDVGLPGGQMGNSEVGHTNLGAGRVVMQDMPRIDAAIADGTLHENAALQTLIEILKIGGGTCHLMGLVSPGGVHSHQTHILALARILDGAGVRVVVHAFLDGRDTPPRSALDYITEVTGAMPPNVRIATVAGRYFAMDRDKRWDRVALAYAAIVTAEGRRIESAAHAVRSAYEADQGDEFVMPTVIGAYDGMADDDVIIMANFRADRAREILEALVDPAFEGFARPRTMRFASALGMVSYSTHLDRFVEAVFPPLAFSNTLGELVAKAGCRQLRIAETEKYAHVTFFFNGGDERIFPGEDRILVPSPRVATYDLQPEMSASEVTGRLVEAIESGTYDFILVNYANTDMVGHTGSLPAAMAAVEAVDQCLGRLLTAVEEAGGVLFITADHGNAERMRDADTDQPMTAHTVSRVPFIVAGGADSLSAENGRLADVAPTLCPFLGIPTPAEMTGHSLVTVAPTGRHAVASAS